MLSVLLAAQLLIMGLQGRRNSHSVGVVTADTTTAARTWSQLSFGRPGERVAISEVFACLRAGPNGEYPRKRRAFKGLLVGRQFLDWPVDIVIRDHLAGPAPGTPTVPTINVHADPLESSLQDASSGGEPIWGWGAGDIAMLTSTQPGGVHSRSPFSVAENRLTTIASGIHRTIRVAYNQEAEYSAKALKDDLLTLHQMAGTSPSAQLLRGLRVAWHHQRTLQALPVRPSQFDRFAGRPPIAARSTATYEPEMRTWARTLGGEIGELAEIIAADLADLREALEKSPPFITELSEVAAGDEEALIVVPNGTAARALLDELGGDVRHGNTGRYEVVSMRSLHRIGTWRRAFVVGVPPRWHWHRLDSGLAAELHLLVLGRRRSGVELPLACGTP